MEEVRLRRSTLPSMVMQSPWQTSLRQSRASHLVSGNLSVSIRKVPFVDLRLTT